MLIDTHCHLADSAFEPDRTAVLERAWSAGLSRIIVIGESRTSADAALALAAGDPRILATAGIHPHNARTWDSEAESWLRRRLADSRVVAVGETGLDFHYNHSSPADQQRAFEAQLGL